MRGKLVSLIAPAIVPKHQSLGRRHSKLGAGCLENERVWLFRANFCGDDDGIKQPCKAQVLQNRAQPRVKIAHYCQLEACRQERQVNLYVKICMIC